jgi:hypothetical protein
VTAAAANLSLDQRAGRGPLTCSFDIAAIAAPVNSDIMRVSVAEKSLLNLAANGIVRSSGGEENVLSNLRRLCRPGLELL